MTVYALFNSKGGVGKTASCVNLAYLSALDGNSTLLWDLDAQGSATFYYRIQPKLKGGMKKLVGGKHSLASSARKTEYASIDLVPSDFSARKMDLLLKNVKKSKSRMGKMLGSLEHRYDSVFLDAPPAFSLVSENIFRAADCILLPLIPTTLSLRSYLQIVQFFEDKELDMGKLAPFFTQVDRRKKVHRETVDLYAGRDNRFLKTWIPYSSDVENMGTHRKPLPAYSQKSKASEAYRSLWAEIKGR